MPSRSLGACLWVQQTADDPGFARVAFWPHSVTAEVRVWKTGFALRLVRLYACRKASELPRRHTACLTALMQLVSGPDDWRNEPHET